MVVTEALVVAYVTRRAIRWYRGDVGGNDRDVPHEDLRNLDDADQLNMESLS